jgi:hypothetical protein
LHSWAWGFVGNNDLKMERFYMPKFNIHDALFEIKEKYINEKFIFITGELMEKILREMGATDADFD